MDPNLRFGISQRQGKIENSRQLLLTNEDAPTLYRDDQRIREAWQRSLSTVHPDNSKLIPALFRPAAFMPLVAPLVFLSMMPVKGIKSMILPQVSLYAYTTAFTITNGNASYSHGPVERTLLGTGVCVSSTLFGLIPHFVHMRYGLDNFWIRKALPIAILAQVSGVNVLASRRLESIRGIEVMDKKGNVIGHSRRAGEKAIKETAISRAVLFGTAAFIPEAFMYYLKKYSAVNLKRKFGLPQKKQNCFITEGCRGEFVGEVVWLLFGDLWSLQVPVQRDLLKVLEAACGAWAAGWLNSRPTGRIATEGVLTDTQGS
uniref:sideroflexin-4 isoform X2 n=1 Tax=Jaculus jaculus TaxID=51337 RepID=UPI001E1B2817|nr:sideroflexin-4 isoform X2 [Jaculus jaculus]